MKNECSSKDTITKIKAKTHWEKICVVHISDNSETSRIYKELLLLNQISDCLGPEMSGGWVLSAQEHEETFGGNRNVLLLDCGDG